MHHWAVTIRVHIEEYIQMIMKKYISIQFLFPYFAAVHHNIVQTNCFLWHRFCHLHESWYLILWHIWSQLCNVEDKLSSMKNDGRNLVRNDYHNWFDFNPEIKSIVLGQNQQNYYIIQKSLKQSFRKLHS